MVLAKVKAAYSLSYFGNVNYNAYDITAYNKDVKDYTRELALFRTDTGELIAQKLLDKDEYNVSTLVRVNAYPGSPVIENLNIKAVLTLTHTNGTVVIAEDVIEFTKRPQSQNGLSLSAQMGVSMGATPTYSVIDASTYPFIGTKQKSNYHRFIYVVRRNTAGVEFSKLQYVAELGDEESAKTFDYFNELVVIAHIVFIDKITHEVFTADTSAFVNEDVELRAYYNAGGIFFGADNDDPFGDEDAVINQAKADRLKNTRLQAEIEEIETCFSITHLIDLFKSYAVNLKELRHQENSFRERSFFNLDFEELQAATREGCKYPLMIFQTPESNKQGGFDNISENWEGSFIILDKLRGSKAETINNCKVISDKIFRRMVADAPRFFDGNLVQSTEGVVGPSTDKLYGWVVTFSFDKAFDGEVNATDWEDLCQ